MGICFTIWSVGYWLINFFARWLYEVKSPIIPKILGILPGIFLLFVGLLIFHAALDLRYFGVIYPEHLL